MGRQEEKIGKVASGRDVKKILSLLNKEYGAPPKLRKTRPIDELIRTILSQNTTDTNSLKAFRDLKKNFKSWDGLLETDLRKIARIIRRGGLADIKAARIKEALSEIRRREGAIDLSSLKNLSVDEALDYLTSLKGVGLKTASCVLLFSFGMSAMPVDTHIYRVSRRLGIINSNININEAHRELLAIVPKDLTLRLRPSASLGTILSPAEGRSGSSPQRLTRDLIYEFHLGIIMHGRLTCKAQNPRCGVCVLYKLCKFDLKYAYKKSYIKRRKEHTEAHRLLREAR